jgi:hypothetical protein
MDIPRLLADFVPSPTARKPLTEVFSERTLTSHNTLLCHSFSRRNTWHSEDPHRTSAHNTLDGISRGSGLDVVAGFVDQRFVHLNAYTSVVVSQAKNTRVWSAFGRLLLRRSTIHPHVFD